MSADRVKRFLRGFLLQIVIILVTLGVAELILRTIDLRYLREGHHRGYKVVYHYDPDIGWAPIVNSEAIFQGSHKFHVRHNSLGLRDIEHDRTPKPTVLFIGDSFTWGYDVEAADRFTELLRPKLPGIRLVNAGVSGYGTDQEYLLLNNIWKTFKPNVVVLIFCVENDRRDNFSNVRYDGYYKPYLKQMPDGSWQFSGRPVPKSRYVYFINNWLVHNLWLARVAVSAYVELRHPQITLPDPTERLIGMMRKFVEARGAKLLIGLQYHEPQLEAYLQKQKIPYASFDGAKSYPTNGSHWTPKGHALVADRLMPLLLQSGIVDAQPAR